MKNKQTETCQDRCLDKC